MIQTRGYSVPDLEPNVFIVIGQGFCAVFDANGNIVLLLETQVGVLEQKA